MIVEMITSVIVAGILLAIGYLLVSKVFDSAKDGADNATATQITSSENTVFMVFGIIGISLLVMVVAYIIKIFQS